MGMILVQGALRGKEQTINFLEKVPSIFHFLKIFRVVNFLCCFTWFVHAAIGPECS